ncbi:protein adenylyltransferase SelO family protein [Sandarakinorhabdus limnophila]|uniref:protein adenylyltransferase SelO family protein n=1 Tax=Sandarakinorhabdus limnophila TaxID=210512 RepID=UPI0026F13292|nr:YdiU family protein [Sandarakinorhabdus limnophila]
MAEFTPETTILELGTDFFDPVEAAPFPHTILRFRNDRAAEQVRLDGLSDDAWLQHFGRFVPLPGSLTGPLALRYHGHQFRTYNPDLGDGRGFLFAQCRDDQGRLMDLGTKGSGTTPWSRMGDGRLTLTGAVREILATEMLEALGVATSRTFSVIETGEKLIRSDEPSPTRAAVLVRLNHSHVRYGSFQRQAFHQNREGLTKLVDYGLTHLAPDATGPTPVAALVDHAVKGAARMAAQYMAAGFVHGVLNTDNINITGESFDYGPWRFAPAWDAGFTAAYFDHSGLYAFGRQAEALQWNLYQLGSALRLIAETDELKGPLETYPLRYRAALSDAVLGRLGVKRLGPSEDEVLVEAIHKALVTTQMDPDRFFFDWRGGVRRGASVADPHYSHDGFTDFLALIPDFAAGAPSHTYWSDEAPCTMLIDEVEALWAPIAERDDWAPLHAKVAAIRRMGEAHAQS